MDYTTKTCASCKIEKPLNNFHKSSASKDGFKSYCKTCRKLKAQSRRRKAAKLNGTDYIPRKERIEQSLKKRDKNCLKCGKHFIAHRSRHDQKFCCTTCANQYNQKPDPNKKSEFICKYCGKVFIGWVYRNPVFCSHHCTSKYAARQPKIRARKPENFVKLFCKTCNKEYSIHISLLQGRNSNYCSKACQGVATSKRMRGSKNPNYRGGTVSYRGKNWGVQRRKDLKRDGCKCQICKKHLTHKKWGYAVHHIKPFREFDSYLEANKLSNLITLCRSCHSKVEWGELPCPKPLL